MDPRRDSKPTLSFTVLFQKRKTDVTVEKPTSSYGRPSTSKVRGQTNGARSVKKKKKKGVSDSENPLSDPSSVPQTEAPTELAYNASPPEELIRLMKMKPVVSGPTRVFFDSIVAKEYVEIKKMLKEKSVNVNERDLEDALLPTPLLVATEINDVEIVKMLLKAKPKPANINDENTHGKRPIWWAAKWANAEIADLLLNGKQKCEVNALDKESGCAPLFRAVLSNSYEVSHLLIRAGADTNVRRIGSNVETPLIKAIQMDSKDICELLLNSLCKMQSKADNGFNALHYAVAYRRYDISKLLLDSGVKVNAKSDSGITALTIAIEDFNPFLVRLLLEYGYKMDRRYKWKETPLEHAIQVHAEDCAITLVHHGCNFTKKKGNSLFFMAVDERLMKLVKFFVALNPVFLNEDWLQRGEWPVSIYHCPEVCEWLQKEAAQPQTLKQLCRARIFRYLGKYPVSKVKDLNLPTPLAEYLKFKEYAKEKYYTKKPLDKGACPFDCPIRCPSYKCPPIEISSSESEGDSCSDDDDLLNGNDDSCQICQDKLVPVNQRKGSVETKGILRHSSKERHSVAHEDEKFNPAKQRPIRNVSNTIKNGTNHVKFSIKGQR